MNQLSLKKAVKSHIIQKDPAEIQAMNPESHVQGKLYFYFDCYYAYSAKIYFVFRSRSANSAASNHSRHSRSR